MRLGAAALAKEQRDLFSQLLVVQPAGPPGLGCVIIEPAETAPQGTAEFTAAIGVWSAMESLNHFVALLGSWPKMAKAFFKMSRCRLTAANSRYSSLIRLCAASEPFRARRASWPYCHFHFRKEPVRLAYHTPQLHARRP